MHTALKASELQLFLDDPMSDPDVRRDEETRATTVEHIKLLRNRLEATNKEHMEELRACLVRTTGDISRQLERAGLGGWRAGTSTEASGCGGGGGGGCGGGDGDVLHRAGVVGDNRRHNEGGVDESRPGLAWSERSPGLEDRLNRLEERLEMRAKLHEERMQKMMGEQLNALARKLDAALSLPLQPAR